MNMDAKKLRERKILDLVYADRRIEEIIPSERPDFLLRCRGGQQFGVEIAELYHSQTTARLDRIPDYSSELLGGGDFRHKDDARHIKVGKVDILTQENEVKYSQIDAIIQDAPAVVECARGLSAMIRAKADKLGVTSSVLSHTNLILHDRTNVLPTISREEFFRRYFLPELRAALAAAPFREVFFLTKMKDGPGFVPLKMLLLMAEAYFFNAIYTATEASLRFPDVAELEVFGSYLATLVKGPVLFRQADDGTEVVYGDSGFFIAPDRSVYVRMYCDLPFPDSARAPRDHLDRLGPEFIGKLEEHRSSNTFITPLLFPTKPFQA
jgi:hypothetical protein